MIRSIMVAAALSLGLISVALAFTPSPATAPKLVSSDLVQVGHKGHKSNKSHHHGKWHDKRWNNAHRYSHAPKGWKHYNYRPYRWSHRGCVVIGNLWYCP